MAAALLFSPRSTVTLFAPTDEAFERAGIVAAPNGASPLASYVVNGTMTSAALSALASLDKSARVAARSPCAGTAEGQPRAPPGARGLPVTAGDHAPSAGARASTAAVPLDTLAGTTLSVMLCHGALQTVTGGSRTARVQLADVPACGSAVHVLQDALD